MKLGLIQTWTFGVAFYQNAKLKQGGGGDQQILYKDERGASEVGQNWSPDTQVWLSELRWLFSKEEEMKQREITAIVM